MEPEVLDKAETIWPKVFYAKVQYNGHTVWGYFDEAKLRECMEGLKRRYPLESN